MVWFCCFVLFLIVKGSSVLLENFESIWESHEHISIVSLCFSRSSQGTWVSPPFPECSLSPSVSLLPSPSLSLWLQLPAVKRQVWRKLLPVDFPASPCVSMRFCVHTHVHTRLCRFSFVVWCVRGYDCCTFLLARTLYWCWMPTLPYSVLSTLFSDISPAIYHTIL